MKMYGRHSSNYDQPKTLLRAGLSWHTLFADFRHGPVAVVEQGFPVIAIVPQGQVADELLDFMRDLREREAELLVISALDEALALAQTPLPLPTGIPEWLSPLVAVAPGQLFAMWLTLAKGFDPNHPRGLRKVTLTR